MHALILYIVFPGNCKEAKEFYAEVFQKLSDQWKVLFPFHDNFGMHKEKYDIQWMFVTHKD